jgi:ABC-type transport system involved in multi-copper enzyme maturation permease subunit
LRQIKAITLRETGSFFHGVTGTVVVTAFLVVVGFLFAKGFVGYSDLSEAAAQSPRSGSYLNLAEGIFRPLVSTMTVFMVLLMPAVTMRLFTTEYSSGRYDLLASWPVPDQVWVLGKWLSSVLVALLLLVCTMAFFLVVWAFGSPEAGPMWSGLLGLLLLAACLGAWGTLWSVWVRHQIVAYLGALVLSFLFFLVGLLERFLPGALGAAARELSLLTHFARFSRGVVDSRDVVYFLLMTAVPLYLAGVTLAGRRLPVARKLPQGMPALLAVVLAVVVYGIGLEFHGSVDLTGNRRYSLAPQTEQILDSLPEKLAGDQIVEVLAFYQRHDPAFDTTEALLLSFKEHSNRFGYRMLDPEEHLDLVRRFGVTLSRTMVVKVGEDFTLVLQPRESGLINAVYRVVSGEKPIVGYVLGHGEHLLDSDEMAGYSSADLVMIEQGYEVRPLFLAQADRIPSNCRVLVIAGPRTEPGPAEVQAINEYLKQGGSVLAMFDPGTQQGWKDWLAGYRIWLSGGVLISADGAGAQFGMGPRTVAITGGYGDHSIVAPLRGVTTLFPMSQALGVVGDPEKRILGDILLTTSELTWVEKDPATMYTGKAEYDRGTDVVGPHPLAVILEVHQQPGTEEGEGSSADRPLPGRMAVVGNSEWMNNSNLNLGGNRDLMLNMLGWLARDETLIEIRGKDPLSEPIILTLNQKKILLWGAPLIWPLFVGSLLLGYMLWRRQGSERPAS